MSRMSHNMLAGPLSDVTKSRVTLEAYTFLMNLATCVGVGRRELRCWSGHLAGFYLTFQRGKQPENHASMRV